MTSGPDAEPSRGRRRAARGILLAAWLLLIAAAAAAVGYVVSAPAPPERTTAVRLDIPAAAPTSTTAAPGEPRAAADPAPEADAARRAADPAAAAADPATGDQAAGDQAAGDQTPGEQAAEPEADAPPPPPADEPDPAAPDAGPDETADAGDAPAQAEADAAPAATEPTGSERTAQSARLPDAPPAAPQQRPAWLRYARSMTPPEGIPKIAVILRGVGLSSAQAEAAVDRLPGTISLSFSGYAMDSARAWAARARRQGHEVLVDLPMEPVDYPTRDPGPQALMTDLTPARNLDRLDWLLSQVDREVGVVAALGSRFLTAQRAVEPVLQELKARGLMYVDNGIVRDGPAIPAAQRLDLPYAVADRSLDAGQVSRPAVEARLVEAERIARQQGLAVVLARSFPTTIDALESWADEVEQRGFVLVPASQAALRTTGRTTANLR